MAKYVYNKWEPVAETVDELYFHELHNGSGKLKILLKKFGQDEVTLVILFDGTLTYRVAQEAARMLTINDNAPMPLFSVSTNSEFLDWFKEDSGGMFNDWSLMHISICNTDNIIDVITNQYPQVEWIK